MAVDKHLDRQAELCREVIQDVHAAVAKGGAADRFLAGWYKSRRYLGSRDRRLLSAVVYSSLRWKGWTKNPAHAFYLDAVERNGAIDRMLKSPDMVQPAGALSLEDKADSLSFWEDRPDPTLTDLFPSWLPEELCLASFQLRPPVWARTRHFFRERVDSRIEALSLDATRHPRVPNALSFSDHVAFTKLRQQVLGLLEIQTLVSQAVGIVCDAKPGQVWWDACCGGGGKTLMLNDMMDYKGRVFATDTRPEAIKQFQMRESHGNLAHIQYQVLDSSIENLSDQMFNGILVDAPCTGLGTWARTPDARWRLRAKHVEFNRDLQFRILNNVVQSLPSGNRLVYSVCTVTPEETTQVVEAFMEKHPECPLEPFDHPLTGEPTDGTVMLHPDDHQGDGMFIARFRKE